MKKWIKVMVLIHTTMRTPSKERGKASQMRAAEDVVFSTKMVALDFELTREEETFPQLVGLDRLVVRVAWEILNNFMVQEVLNNLDPHTMGSSLND